MTFRAGVPAPNWRGVHRLFKQQVRQVRERFGATVSVASSMEDHVHLIIQTSSGRANLGETMRFLASRLALSINRAFGRKGSVYRDRYFSRPLRSVSELIRAIRYVAMNPVAARLSARPEAYPYSSVPDYLVKNPDDSPWAACGWMFRLLGFGGDPARALRDILEGRRSPVVARGSRQQRLPFAKGLPEYRSSSRRAKQG